MKYKLLHDIFASLIGLAVAAGWTIDALYRKAKSGVLFACCSAALAALLLFVIGSNVYGEYGTQRRHLAVVYRGNAGSGRP